MERRAFLKAGAGLAAAPRFRHRGYLGWITDLATSPDAEAAWPSLRVDGALLEDYRRTFALLERLGFNEISIWGLYVARDWPVEIASCLSRERGAMVERIIDAAHRQGLRVYAGLGVYSWGFERIIREFPRLSRGNPRAMCASEPAAWEWMRRVIDFVFTRLPVDGVSMQSADQGRCGCEQCRAHSDMEYHALLNERAGLYLRDRWRGKTTGVNSWGMRFGDPGSLAALQTIARNVDYIIDAHDNSRAANPAYRRELIARLACDFGTLGGPQVEPPQHWARDRWFLPTAKRQAQDIGDLAADGGRACEYFFHILENPGDEISLHVAGRALRAPGVSWEKHLRDAVEEVYGARGGALAELFVEAEDAYFQFQPPRLSGTISMEPLEVSRAGPPVYLTERLRAPQRRAYAEALERVAVKFRRIAPDVPDQRRMGKVLACLGNAIAEAYGTQGGAGR